DNCSESYTGDLNNDCTVNFDDLAIFSGEWLTSDLITPIISDLNGDKIVNLKDFVLFAEQWLQISEPYIFFPVSDIVWRVDDPLYKELLSINPVGMAQEGAFTWAHLMVYDNCRKIANQFGLKYVYEDSQKMNAENNLMYIANQYVFESSAYNLAYYDDLYGLQNVVTIGDLTAVIPDHDYGGKTSLFPDPVINQAVMDKAEHLVQTSPQWIWALYTGDETHEITDKGGVTTFASSTKPAYMTIADAEVKTQYGNGVYGIPLSLTDTNPYRWIAYRRWLNEKLINRMGDVYNMVKAEEPDIKLISYDPIAGHHPYDFSTWYGKCDILTHQLYPIQDKHSVKFGFTTKLIKDISGIEEVWPCFHVENYATSFTPEEVLELVSQAFRNGATGFHIYPADTIGLRSGINYLAHEYYGAPERWQLLMKLVDEASKMNKLQFPEPDFAVMYSGDTYASQGYYINSSGVHSGEVEYAYTLLGPNAKSWFKFIDDNQIERQSANIADFNAIYIPFAKYERESTIQKLQQYVSNGGTLISTDPEIFSYNAWGNSMASYRSTIFGVTLNGTQSVSTINYQGLSMPVYGTAYNINTSGCTVLATFNNGKPAIVSHPYGSGKAIFFAANPFASSSVISSESWISFFKSFQTYLDLRTDQDIWRFRFPYSLVKPVAKPNGQCLTNNYIFWQGFAPINILNLNTGGTYKYSLAPDTYADISGADIEIPFSSGKLTNRRSATGSANSLALGKSLYSDWIVRYSASSLSAFTITFDLKQSYPIGKVKLFTAGQLPKLDLYGSNNGTDWQKLNETGGPVANSSDVLDTTLDGNGQSCRYLRVDFSVRDNLLGISEVEIWTN
ncbi:MAG: beta-galactosidase trimerization domain-containing protein, partial [Planctomycetaceae bacterium]|nr:beta-galactosidase trimerization domain-containing protein [Planctomycetaceae bacterium]